MSRQTPDQASESGTLWVVATPIGNLEDLTPRAARLLSEVAVIAAEDTRVSRRLLPQRAAAVDWVSLHDHNEQAKSQQLIERLRAGDDVALISDAGTPLVSDPGYRLVAAAHDAGIAVRAVPGACAAIAALSVAGLPSDRFRFEGFLPARSEARRKRLDSLAGDSATLIFYVPARDLPAILGDMSDSLGPDRPATVVRELTKRFETVRRATLAELAAWVASDEDQQRGEAVVLVEGNEATTPAIDASALATELARELPPSRAAKVLARLTGMKRQQAWTLIEAKQDDT